MQPLYHVKSKQWKWSNFQQCKLFCRSSSTKSGTVVCSAHDLTRLCSLFSVLHERSYRPDRVLPIHKQDCISVRWWSHFKLHTPAECSTHTLVSWFMWGEFCGHKSGGIKSGFCFCCRPQCRMCDVLLISVDLWLPNSPDLNPVHYYAWSILWTC